MLVNFKIQREDAIDCGSLEYYMKEEISALIQSGSIKTPEDLSAFIEVAYGIKILKYIGYDKVPEVCELFGDASIDIDRSQEAPEKSWSNAKYSYTGISKPQILDVRNGGSIALFWSSVDVIETAKNSGFKLTEDQAKDILQIVDKRHDANIGVDWEVLDTHIAMYAGDHDLKEYLYKNQYRCEDCALEWEDVWDSACDDKCPECETAHTPFESEEI